jgi:ribosomal protein S18 acetylase RimI-like enzyme
MIEVRQATLEDLPEVAALFDAYRQFYELPADLPVARAYMQERLAARDSVVLVATRPGSRALLGFCQLYPSRCSLLAAPIYILYDLFVAPPARGGGAARALMQAATERARQDGKARMELQTARTNHGARALYAALGWQLDETFLTYTLPLT